MSLFTKTPLLILTLCVLTLSPAIHAENLPLYGLNGKTMSLDQYKGKVVWLDFWASWCVPCRASFPWMNEMQKKYESSGFEVVAINLDKERPEVDRFLKHYPASFSILLDPTGKSALHYKVKGMPSSYILDKNGEVVEHHLGFKQDELAQYESKIQQYLK